METTIIHLPSQKKDISTKNILIYLFSLSLVLASILSQYIIHPPGIISKFSLTYGIPIAVITLFYGKDILKNSLRKTGKALDYGLAYWGVLSVVSYIAGIIMINVIATFDPAALSLLDRANPVIPTSTNWAWVMTFFSFLIIGPAEEYIFRGFVFGRLLKIFHGKHWFALAFLSSLIFAFVHLYYLLTFGITSAIIFTDIIAIGMALAIAYYASGGNLIVPALLHGAFDASGFFSIAIGSNVGTYFRIFMVGLGLILALGLIIRHYILHTPDIVIQ